MRLKPDDAPLLCWEGFEEWADENNIGTLDSEWMPFWKCYESGHLQGFSEGY